MVTASAILIAVYVAVLVGVLAWPARQRHPEDGMAIGCLGIVIAGLCALGLVLAAAAYFQLRLLVNIIFAATVFPALLIIPQLAVLAAKKLRQRAADRGVPIEADRLAGRLRGQTHVIRCGSVDPPREWQELHYFSPAGIVVRYREEGGRIERVDAVVTWAVEGGRLVTLNDIQPGNRITYRLADTPDGRVAYYIHAPGSRANGVLSRRTWAVRSGEPAVTPTDPSADPQPAIAAEQQRGREPAKEG